MVLFAGVVAKPQVDWIRPVQQWTTLHYNVRDTCISVVLDEQEARARLFII
jgi:hypothetical protein